MCYSRKSRRQREFTPSLLSSHGNRLASLSPVSLLQYILRLPQRRPSRTTDPTLCGTPSSSTSESPTSSRSRPKGDVEYLILQRWSPRSIRGNTCIPWCLCSATIHRRWRLLHPMPHHNKRVRDLDFSKLLRQLHASFISRRLPNRRSNFERWKQQRLL